MYKISLGQACDLCLECVDVCQGKLLTEEELKRIQHNNYVSMITPDCTFCESCMDACPEEAIRIDIV